MLLHSQQAAAMLQRKQDDNPVQQDITTATHLYHRVLMRSCHAAPLPCSLSSSSFSRSISPTIWTLWLQRACSLMVILASFFLLLQLTSHQPLQRSSHISSSYSSSSFPFLFAEAQGTSFNFTCCHNPSFTYPNGTFVSLPNCCCDSTLYSVFESPVTFLANWSTDAVQGGGSYTGNPLEPGTIRSCNCSITTFSYHTYPNITYDSGTGIYTWVSNYTALPFTCKNTTYVPPYIPPPKNYTYDLLMQEATFQLNFTAPNGAAHWNRKNYNDYVHNYGTALFGYNQDYYIDAFQVNDIGLYTRPLIRGVLPYSAPGSGTCTSANAFLIGPDTAPFGFSGSTWIRPADFRMTTTTSGTATAQWMPLLFMQYNGCGYTLTWSFGLNSQYQPFITESSTGHICVFPVTVKKDAWSHLQFAHAPTGEVNFWLNGHQSTIPCVLEYFPHSTGYTIVTIGRGPPPTSYSFYDRFWGEMAEFTLWNRTMTNDNMLMQHVYREPAALLSFKHNLNIVGAPSAINYMPSGLVQNISWTLPWAYNSYDYDPDVFNTITLTYPNGTDYNYTYALPRNPNMTDFERPLVLGLSCSDPNVMLNLQQNYTYDLHTDWQTPWAYTYIAIQMPANISSFNITWYVISGNATRLNLPYTLNFRNTNYLEQRSLRSLYFPFSAPVSYCTAAGGYWNPINAGVGEDNGGMVMTDAFLSQQYDLLDGNCIGFQSMPQLWNSQGGGWTFSVWVNHTYLNVESTLIRSTFSGTAPFGAQTLSYSGTWTLTMSSTTICYYDSTVLDSSTSQTYFTRCFPNIGGIPRHQWYMVSISQIPDGTITLWHNGVVMGRFYLIRPALTTQSITSLIFGGQQWPIGTFGSASDSSMWSLGHMNVFSWALWESEMALLFANPPSHISAAHSKMWVHETLPYTMATNVNFTLTFSPGGMFMPNLTLLNSNRYLNLSISCLPAGCLAVNMGTLSDSFNLTWAMTPNTPGVPKSVTFWMPVGVSSDLQISFVLFGDIVHHLPPDNIYIRRTTTDLLTNRVNSNLTTLAPPTSNTHGWTNLTNPVINGNYVHGMCAFINNWQKALDFRSYADGLQNPPASAGLTPWMDDFMPTWSTGFAITMWVYQYIPFGGQVFSVQKGGDGNSGDAVFFGLGQSPTFGFRHNGVNTGSGTMNGWQNTLHQWFLFSFSVDKQYQGRFMQYTGNQMYTSLHGTGAPLAILGRTQVRVGHNVYPSSAYQGGLDGLNGIIAQVSYFNNSLFPWEIQALNDHPPPALSAGMHQIFQMTPMPKFLPTRVSFVSYLRLPHLVGEPLTLNMQTVPPGLIQPTSISWIPRSTNPLDIADQLINITMPDDTSLISIRVEFWVTGDYQHYAPLPNCTIFNYMTQPSKVLSYSYPLFIQDAVFNVNTSITSVNAGKDPLMPGVISFDGISQWLNLGLTGDTGVSTPVPASIFNYDVTNGYPHLYTKGWTFTTWLQLQAYGRDHPILSCGRGGAYTGEGFHVSITPTFPTSPGITPQNNWYITFTTWNSMLYTPSSCSVGAYPSANTFIYSWNLLSVSIDSYAIIRIFMNGVELASNQCQFPLVTTRDTCWFGRHFTDPRYMTGRVAGIQFWDRALTTVELTGMYQTKIANMHNTPFQFPPWTPPPFLLNGLSLQMYMYPPHPNGGVTVCATTDPPGFMSPTNITWTAGYDPFPKTWTVSMPLYLPYINVSWSICDLTYPFPIYGVPQPTVIQNLTYFKLYASATQQITMSAPGKHNIWQANLRKIPGLGTTITTTTSDSYLNVNDPLDVAAGSIVPVDPLMISHNQGFTVSMWLIIETPGTIFEFDRFKLQVWDDTTLNIDSSDYASGFAGGCSISTYTDSDGHVWPGGHTDPNTYITDEWFHLMFTWNHWDGILRIYSNGVQVLNRFCGAPTIRTWNQFYAGAGLGGANGFDGQLANFYMWPRALYQWEAQLLYEATPKNIIPVKFRYHVTNFTTLPLALGWDTYAYVQYAEYLSFGTHPTLIPYWQCARKASIPCQPGETQICQPPRNQLYDMTYFFKTTWLMFTLSPGPFMSTNFSGMVPEIALTFGITNDTLNYVTPADVLFGMPLLLNSTLFHLVVDLPSKNANWSIGGPANWTGGNGGVGNVPGLVGGIAVLNQPVGALANTDTDVRYLDLYSKYDTKSLLKAPKNTMSTVIGFSNGFTLSSWIKLNQVPVNRTQTLWWCGVNDGVNSDKNAIVVSFQPPDRRVQVKFTNLASIRYLPVTSRCPDGCPYVVYFDCICQPSGAANSTIPVDRWFQLAITIDTNSTVSVWQSGQLLQSCWCGGSIPQYFRDTCVLGQNPNNFFSKTGKSDYVAAPNYFAPFNGSIAAFEVWDRQLLPQEVAALSQSPPHTLWPYPMEFRDDLQFSLSSLYQNGTFTVTPGLSVWSGLTMAPTLVSPTWYNPGPMYLIIANLSSNNYDTKFLNFPPLSLQNTVTFFISWPAIIPYVQLPLNMSNKAHYVYPQNYTIVNPLPWIIYNTSYFRLNTTVPNQSAKWRSSYSFVPNTGVVLFNDSTAPSLDLMNVADTNAQFQVNNDVQGNFNPTMPLRISPNGMSFVGWFMFPNTTIPPPGKVDFFRWAPSSMTSDLIALSITYPSGQISFRYHTSTAPTGTPDCECVAPERVPWNNFLPIIATLGPTGNMTIGVGKLFAQWGMKNCTCTTTQYPTIAIDRPAALLGGVASGMEVSTFYYFEKQLTYLEQQILYYAPPAAISPSNWVLRTVMPDHLFLNEPFVISWELNSWTTISGPVTMNIVPSQGYVIPSQLTFTALGVQNFTFVSDSNPGYVTISAYLTGDTLYHNGVPDLKVYCYGGRFTLTNVPDSMIPTYPMTVTVVPNVAPPTYVTLRWWVTVPDVQLSVSQFTWNGTDAIGMEPLNFVIFPQVTNATYFFLNFSVDVGGEGIYYLAPQAYNISLSYVSRIVALTPGPQFLYSYERSMPIVLMPLASPPNGVNLTITTDIGNSVLSTSNMYFPGGSVASRSLWITAPYTAVDTFFTVSFNISGIDELVFVSFPKPMVVQWRFQRLMKLVEIPQVLFPTQHFQIGVVVSEALNWPRFMMLRASWDGAQNDDEFFPYLSHVNFTTNADSPYELAHDIISYDLTHYFYGVMASASGSFPSHVVVNISVDPTTTDIGHFIWDRTTLPIGDQLIIPTGGLVFIQAESPVSTMRANTSITISFVCLSQPFRNVSQGNMTITPSSGSVYPSTVYFNYYNWDQVQNVTFFAPNFYDEVTFSYDLAGLDSGQFVPPPDSALDVYALGYFVMTDASKTLWLGQPSVFTAAPVGYQPGCYMTYICTPAQDSIFDPQSYITFSPLVSDASFVFFAPTYYPDMNITMSFKLVGGPDLDKMYPPKPFVIRLNRTDLYALNVWGGSWTSPLGLPSYQGLLPLNFTGHDPLTGYWYNRNGFGYWFEYNSTVIHALGYVTVNVTYQTPGSVSAYVITQAWTGPANNRTLQKYVSPSYLLPNQTIGTLFFNLSGVGRSVLVVTSTADNMVYRYNIERMPTDAANVQLTTDTGMYLQGFGGGITGAPMNRYVPNWNQYSAESFVIGPYQIPYNVTHIRLTLNFTGPGEIDPYAYMDEETGFYHPFPNECTISWINEFNPTDPILQDGASNFYRYNNIAYYVDSNGTTQRNVSYYDQGPLLQMSLGTNLIYLNCSLDGVYVYNLTRAAPNLYGVTMNSADLPYEPYVTSTIQGGYTLLPFTMYNLTVPYGTTLLNFNPMFLLNNTIGLGYMGQTWGVLNQINTWNSNPSIYIPFPSTIVQLMVYQEYQYINYYFNITRLPSNVMNVTITGSTIGVSHTLYTVSYTPAVFPTDTDYSQTVTYKTDSISFAVGFTAAQSLVLTTSDPRNPASTVLYNDVLASNTPTRLYNLSIGDNWFHVNSSLDGCYHFKITRNPPELTDSNALQLLFDSQNTTGTFTSAFMANLWPPFQPGALDLGYNLTLPFIWKDVKFWFNSTSATNSLSMTLNGSSQAAVTSLRWTNSAGSLVLNLPQQYSIGVSTLWIDSPNDGTYVFTVNILPPDIHAVTFSALDQYAFPGNPGVNTLTLNAPTTQWSSFNYSYTATPPYIMTSISLWVNFSTPNSVWVDQLSGSQFQLLSSTVNSIQFIVPAGISTFRLQSSLDGVYSFVINRVPDLAGISVRSTVDARAMIYTAVTGSFNPPNGVTPYLGSATGETAGLDSVPFLSAVNYANVTVPFVFSQMDVYVKSLTSQNYSLDYWSELQSNHGFVPLAPIAWFSTFPLDLGVNLLHVNMTLDGTYTFQLVRLQGDLLNFTLSPLPATTSWEPMPVMITSPLFQRNRLGIYSVTVTMSVGYVQVFPTFMTTGSVVAYLDNGQSFPMASGSLSSAIPLKAAANNTITLVSTQDGNYTLIVERLGPDSLNITITAFNDINTPTVISAANYVPQVTPGVYTYTVTVPYGTSGLSINAVSGSGHSSYISAENGGAYFPLAFQEYNRVNLNNTVDGQFEFIIVWAAPDIRGVEVRLTNGLQLVYTTQNIPDPNPVPFLGAATGGTAGSTGLIFVPYNHSYLVTIPYIYNQITLMANSSTDNTATLDIASYTVFPQLSPFPRSLTQLIVGDNVIRLNSTLDGFYKFTIVRLNTDIIDVQFTPIAATPGFTGLPTVSLSPSFSQGTFNYSTVVPLVVGQVQLTITFSTVGSVYAVLNGTTYAITSGALSLPIPLQPAALNQITVYSSQDGVYNFNVTRLAAAVVNTTLTAYNGNHAATPAPLEPPFTNGVYQYTITVSYGTQEVGLTAVTTAGTSSVTGDWLTGNGNGLLVLDHVNPLNNYFTLNNTQDGFYVIYVQFGGVDLLGIEILAPDGKALIYTVKNTPHAVHVPYVGAATGGTAGQNASIFSPLTRYYSIVLPFIYNQVSFIANTTTNATITFDTAYPANPFHLWNAYMPYTRMWWDLSVGGNALHMNSTIDGLYEFEFTRLDADLYGMNFDPVAATPGFTGLPTISLTPTFTQGILEYNTTVPLSVGAVTVTVRFNTVGSVYAVSNGTTIPVVDNVASIPMNLKPASINYITIHSSMDGVYMVNITRLGPAVSNISLIATDAFGVNTAGTLSPVFTPGVYDYSVTVPFGAQTVTLSGSTTSGSLVVSNGGVLVLDPLNPLNNVLTMQDAADGIYTISINYGQPDVKALVLQHPNGQTLVTDSHLSTGIAQVPYVAPTTGQTANSTYQTWNARVNWYSFLVPFLQSSVNVAVNFSTTNTLSVDYIDAAGVYQVVRPTAGVFTLNALHLVVGWNRFNVNSTLDGYYAFNVWRALPDVLGFTIVPYVGTAPPSSAAPLPLTLTLSPTFLYGTFIYQVTASLPIFVTGVQVTANYSVPNSFHIQHGATPILIPTGGVYSSPSQLAVGANNLTLISTADGTYIITITRALPDVSSLGLTGYNTAGVGVYTPTLVPSYTAGVFTYNVAVPFGAVSVSDFSTTVIGGASSLVSSGGSNYSTSMPILFDVTNVYNVSSSLDGVYTFNIIRLPQDVLTMNYEGWHRIYSYWQNLWLTGRTFPKFTDYRQLNYHSYVKYEVDRVRFKLTWNSYPLNGARVYMQNNSTQNRTLYKLDVLYNNYTGALPIDVGENFYTIETTLDGNYTFSILRNASTVDPCSMMPCLFGSTCVSNYSLPYDVPYTCICVNGYSGANCDIPKVPLAPNPFNSPVAVLSAPAQLLGNCDDLILDGRSSYGQLLSPSGTYVDPASVGYTFFVNRILTDQGVDLIASKLVPAGVNLTLGTNLGYFPYPNFPSYLVVPANYLVGNVTYEIGLTVYNEQVTGNPAFVMVRKLLNDTCIPWMPVVSILPPALIQRPNVNLFKVLLTPGKIPLPSDAVFDFSWTVSIKAGGVTFDTASSTTYPTRLGLRTRELTVPPFWLFVGEIYYLRLTVSITSPSGGGINYGRRLLAVTSLTGTTDCQVTVNVPPSNLQAIIVGGNRQRSVDLALQVDGSRSFDPDNANLATSPIKWTWDCKIVSDVTNLTPTPPPCAIPGSQLNSPSITLPSGALTAGVTYEFKLVVTSLLVGDSRSGTTSVDIDTTPPPMVATPIVLIVGAPSQINSIDILRLNTFVVSPSGTPLYELQYAWTSDPYLNLVDPAVLGGTANASTLVIRSGVLQPGFRLFTITVTDPFYNASASASVLISVNFPPTGGSCSITPTNGYAYSTSFYLQCQNWYDPSGAEPFRYAVKYEDLADSTHTLKTLTTASYQSYVITVLPQGQLRLTVSISNTLGAVAYYPLYVNVTLPASAIDNPLGFIQNLTNSALSNAIASGDTTTAITLIGSLADLLNTVPTGSTTDGNGFTGSTVADVRSDLLNTLSGVVGNSSMSPSTATIVAQALVALTNSTDGASPQDLAVAQQLAAAAISAIPANSDADVNKTSLVDQLGTVVSNLLTNCTDLDAVGGLMSNLLDAAANGTVAGETGADLSNSNIQGTVVRSDLSSGASLTTNGVSISLPPSVVANYSDSLNQITSGNIDAANTNPLALDTKVYSYDPKWAYCRPSDDGQLSSLTDIKVTLSNGQPVDFGKLTGNIEFDMPITTNCNKTVIDCPTEPPVSVCANAQCAFFNPTTKSYNTSGCTSLGPTNNGTAIRCSCSHLTEFSILQRQSRARLGTCPSLDDTLGAWWYLLFMILYSICGLIGLIQFSRVYYKTRCKYWLMTVEMALIFVFCFFRALNMAIFWRLHNNLSVPVQTLIAGLPYCVLSWIYTFVIFAWASIYHTSQAGKREENPFASYQSKFVIMNIIISGVLFVIFLAVANSNDLNRIKTLSNAGTVIIALVSLMFCIFLSVYGTLLVRSLTKDFVSPYARKLAIVAVSLSTCFALSAITQLIDVGASSTYDAHQDAFEILYFTFDWIGVVIVLCLFAKSIHDSLKLEANPSRKSYMVRKGSINSQFSLRGQKLAPALAVAAPEAENSISSSLSDSEGGSSDESEGSMSGSDNDGSESSRSSFTLHPDLVAAAAGADGQTDSPEIPAAEKDGDAVSTTEENAEVKAESASPTESEIPAEESKAPNAIVSPLELAEAGKVKDEVEDSEKKDDTLIAPTRNNLLPAIDLSSTTSAPKAVSLGGAARAATAAMKLRNLRMSRITTAAALSTAPLAGAAPKKPDGEALSSPSSKFSRKPSRFSYGLPTAEVPHGSPVSVIGSPSTAILSPSGISLMDKISTSPTLDDVVLPGSVMSAVPFTLDSSSPSSPALGEIREEVPELTLDLTKFKSSGDQVVPISNRSHSTSSGSGSGSAKNSARLLPQRASLSGDHSPSDIPSTTADIPAAASSPRKQVVGATVGRPLSAGKVTTSSRPSSASADSKKTPVASPTLSATASATNVPAMSKVAPRFQLAPISKPWAIPTAATVTSTVDRDRAAEEARLAAEAAKKAEEDARLEAEAQAKAAAAARPYESMATRGAGFTLSTAGASADLSTAKLNGWEQMNAEAAAEEAKAKRAAAESASESESEDEANKSESDEESKAKLSSKAKASTGSVTSASAAASGASPTLETDSSADGAPAVGIGSFKSTGNRSSLVRPIAGTVSSLSPFANLMASLKTEPNNTDDANANASLASTATAKASSAQTSAEPSDRSSETDGSKGVDGDSSRHSAPSHSESEDSNDDDDDEDAPSQLGSISTAGRSRPTSMSMSRSSVSSLLNRNVSGPPAFLAASAAVAAKANMKSMGDVVAAAQAKAKSKEKPLSRMQLLAMEAIAKAAEKKNRPKVKLGFGSAVAKPSAVTLTSPKK